MTLPSSGTISLGDIQTEFGGSNPIGMNEYYNNGGIVPNGTLGASGLIPSSGTISLSNFYGSKQVPTTMPVQVLIVGGGGGGARRGGSDNDAGNGAGGAGGMITASFNLPKGTYSFTIGNGGVWTTGGNTVAFGYTAYGGGYGGPSDYGGGGNGGSGGGGADRNRGAHGYAIQPNPTNGDYGGQPGYGYDGYGGGGGAGGASGGGGGGPGRQWINGNYYAGGGASTYSGASGGIGGGGSGYYDATYYGGGGGGGPPKYNAWRGTVGYQGIVIVSYQWDFQVMTGGSVTSAAGTGGPGATYRYYHTFTTSGTSITY